MYTLKTRVVSVDKAMAELLLSFERTPEVGVSGTNRRASQDVVNSYARLMAAEPCLWRVTHQGIAFKGFLDDNTAVLADGGQRLRAVLEADKRKPGIKIDFMLTEGMTDEDVLAMDIGRKRTPGDFFVMKGYTQTRLLASVARLGLLYDYPDPEMIASSLQSKLVFSPQELEDYVNKYPVLHDAVQQGARANEILRPTAAGAGWFLAVRAGHQRKDAIEFIDGLRFGHNLPEGSAINVLRELMRKSAKLHRVYDTPEQLALFIKAFRKWFDGAYVKQLAWRVDEKFPRF